MKHFLGFTVICCLCILSCAKNERENEPWVLPVVDDVCTRMESDALKDYCLRHFDTDHDGTLSMQEAAKVSVINLYRVNIYGFNNGLSSVNPIKGIEYFVNLTCLHCYRMGLYHINLSCFPKLEVLNCSLNALSEINLSDSEKLQELQCQYNNLKSIDLSGCPNLHYITCFNNKDLKYLDVSGCKYLTTLVTPEINTLYVNADQYEKYYGNPGSGSIFTRYKGWHIPDNCEWVVVDE